MSKYRGVSAVTSDFYRHHRVLGWTGYEARITANGVTHYLGDFDTEEEAALAYNTAALQLHAKPKLNTVVMPEPPSTLAYWVITIAILLGQFALVYFLMS